MSFKNLNLPDQLIADLFKNSLIDFRKPLNALAANHNTIDKKVPDIKTEKPIAFLGSHLKKISIIVNYRDVVHLPEKHLTFLINVLKACQLTLADIAVINQGNQNLSFEDLKTSLDPVTLIFFGIKTSTIRPDLELTEYTVSNFDGITFLNVPALDNLNRNDEEGKLLKSRLWICLKEVFHV